MDGGGIVVAVVCGFVVSFVGLIVVIHLAFIHSEHHFFAEPCEILLVLQVHLYNVFLQLLDFCLKAVVFYVGFLIGHLNVVVFYQKSFKGSKQSTTDLSHGVHAVVSRIVYDFCFRVIRKSLLVICEEFFVFFGTEMLVFFQVVYSLCHFVEIEPHLALSIIVLCINWNVFVELIVFVKLKSLYSQP